MFTKSVFDWAKRTPDNTAIVWNDHHWSYAVFTRSIALARGYCVRRGIGDEGVAVLAIHNLLHFWIVSLALRSLGVTTIAASSPDTIAGLGLPNIRWVLTSPAEAWPTLGDRCAEQGWPLSSVSLGGETGLDLDAGPV